MIALLFPAALVGLIGLAVPIVIHLQRRQDRQMVDFAALRWLRRRAVPREQWRWQERWLLLLRLVLVAAAVALVARPVWRRTDVAGVPWVAVSPAVPLAAARAAVNAPGAQWHWLAPGWPGVDLPPPAARPAEQSSLVRDLDDTLPAPTSLTLIVPDRLDASDAAGLQLRRSVVWRPVPTTAAAPPASPPRLHIAFRIAGADDDELTVARATVRAWHLAAPALGWDVPKGDADAPATNVTQPIAAETAFTFWLGAAPDPTLDAWIDAGGTALVTGRRCPGPSRSGDAREEAPVSTDGDRRRTSTSDHQTLAAPVLTGDDGTPVVVEQARGRGRLWCLSGALTPESTPALRDPATPATLLAALVAGRARPGPMPVDAAALAPQALPGPPRPAAGQPLDTLFGVVIAALFLAERWWATRAGRLVA